MIRKPRSLEVAAQLHAKATPGPWVFNPDGVICSTSEGATGAPLEFTFTRAGETVHNPDAQFVAQARSLIPTLLAHIEHLYDLLEGRTEPSEAD